MDSRVLKRKHTTEALMDLVMEIGKTRSKSFQRRWREKSLSGASFKNIGWRVSLSLSLTPSLSLTFFLSLSPLVLYGRTGKPFQFSIPRCYAQQRESVWPHTSAGFRSSVSFCLVCSLQCSPLAFDPKPAHARMDARMRCQPGSSNFTDIPKSDRRAFDA